MFKKYYKEANDDIKPRDEFVSKVIKKAKKGRPPIYKRYAKYAAAAAAAVVVVSGAVLSMPLWKSVNEDKGVIVEERAVTTASPSPASAAVQTPAPDMKENKTAESKAAEKAKNSSKSEQGSTSNTAQKSQAVSKVNGSGNSFAGIPSSKSSAAVSTGGTEKNEKSEETKQENTQTTENVSDTVEDAGTKSTVKPEKNKQEPTEQNSVVADSNEAEARVYSAPEDMAPYEEKKTATTPKNSKKTDDMDVPTPSGYYCVSATPRGYTFQNDDGAVIEVSINYGGEERAPYIEEDGDSIYAVFTSYGMSVTINARGAERASVEEIINQLR